MPTFRTARTVGTREYYKFKADSLEHAQSILDKINNDEPLVVNGKVVDFDDIMEFDDEKDIHDSPFDFLEQE